MEKFKFQVNDVFGLTGRGLVFRGNVISGSLLVNQSLHFESGGIEYSASVSLIELNRGIIKKTVTGKELGLLLDKFNVKKINSLYMNAPDIDEIEKYPTVEEVLKIEYPIMLTS